MSLRVMFGFFGILFIAEQAIAGDVEAGREKAMRCAGCHGEDGYAVQDGLPHLAGQNAAYLVSQMQSFKANTRVNPVMNRVAAMLNDTDMQDIAAYYFSLGCK